MTALETLDKVLEVLDEDTRLEVVDELVVRMADEQVLEKMADRLAERKSALVAAQFAERAELDEKSQELYMRAIRCAEEYKESNTLERIAHCTGYAEIKIEAYRAGARFKEAAFLAEEHGMLERALEFYKKAINKMFTFDKQLMERALAAAKNAGDQETVINCSREYIRLLSGKNDDKALALAEQEGLHELAIEILNRKVQYEQAALYAKRHGLQERSKELYQRASEFFARSLFHDSMAARYQGLAMARLCARKAGLPTKELTAQMRALERGM